MPLRPSLLPRFYSVTTLPKPKPTPLPFKSVQDPHDKKHTVDDRSAWDFAAQTLLITDIMRGLWMTLEGFFKPPYTIYYPYEKGRNNDSMQEREEKDSWTRDLVEGPFRGRIETV
jgi:hypothetical protein